jgi:hypothetical protein
MTRRIEYAEARDGVVVIMGEEAILTTRDASTSSTVRRRFTDIWQWNDGSWQLAVCQITVLSPEAV